MKPQSFIFTGRSGVGKGTQAALLIEYLKKKDTKKVLYFASGDGLREYIKGTKHSHKLAKQIYDTGGLFPEFLAVHNWSHFFSENMEGDEHVILDGLPRKLCEAQILDTAFHSDFTCCFRCNLRTFGDDQSGAGTLHVIFRIHWLRHIAQAGAVSRHRRHHHAVLQRVGTKLDR